MAPKVEEAGTTMEYTRLHITPFNASLLSAIVPPSMSHLAKNISFHNIETFPEKAYGYVELPKEQATKIKQKLNGAVLRGSKIVIQEARAAPRIVSPDPEMAKREKKRKEKKAKGEIPQPEEKLEDSAPKEKNRKRKRHDEPLKGQEVTDRQIKRGWTDPNAESKAQKKEKRSRDKALDRQAKKDKKAEREKSKYTTDAEALIRTTLPPNVLLPAKGIEGVVVDKKAKKSKNGKKEVVIHEFARTEKFATFLRQKTLPGAAKPAAQFREGEGWFDEDGNKVEGEPPKNKHNDEVLEKIKEENKLEKPKKVNEKATPEPGPESEEESEDEVMNEAPKMIYNSDSETSSSGSSASESEDEESADEAGPTAEKKDDIEDIFAAVGSSSDSESGQASPPAAKPADKVMAVASSPASVAAKSPSPAPPPSAKTAVEEPVYIHTTSVSIDRPVTPVTSSLKIAIPENPLEAIFKPKKAATSTEPTEESSTPFSFGNLGADIDSDYEEEEEFTIEQAPMTPFTQQDVAWRNVRSAAPTPDTAHPSRKQVSGWPGNEDEEDVNGFNSRSSPTEAAKGGKGKAAAVEEEGPKGTDPNADFQKWFYENRGDTNRAWKKRRKEVKKEVRQRENRKGGNNKLQ